MQYFPGIYLDKHISVNLFSTDANKKLAGQPDPMNALRAMAQPGTMLYYIVEPS